MREELQAPVEEAAIADLTEVAGNKSLSVRELETRRLIGRLAVGRAERLVLDSPVLTLEVAGRLAYLEPDAITHRIDGRFYVVGIKSFAAIDGQADPRAVAQAAKQAAVHVLALRRAFEAAGLAPELIAYEFLLVCPKDFANRPYGRLVDVRQELDSLTFQLERLRRADDIAALLSPDATFDVSASPGELTDSLRQLDATYRPDCLSFCELSRFCRDEATSRALPARLGSGVRNALPGIDSTRTALTHLDGTTVPGPAEAPAVELLRAADRLRRLRRGGAA